MSLTSKERKYNESLKGMLHHHLKEKLIPDLINIVSDYGKIRGVEYEYPGKETAHMKSVSEFVHKEIYSSDEMPWILFIEHTAVYFYIRNIEFYRNYIAVLRPYVSKWKRQTVEECIKRHFLVLRADDENPRPLMYGRVDIGTIMRCPESNIEEMPFPVHARVDAFYRGPSDHFPARNIVRFVSVHNIIRTNQRLVENN